MLALLLSLADRAPAQATFTERFESGLGQWIGRGSCCVYSPKTVPDPLESDTALTFTSTTASGDASTLAQFPAGSYALSFDYLGRSVSGSQPDDYGGFIGIVEGVPARSLPPHRWLEGTRCGVGAESCLLIDDGKWHHYVILVTHPRPFRIMLEDYSGAAGDVFFDNIRLDPMPTYGSGCPGTLRHVPELLIEGSAMAAGALELRSNCFELKIQ